MQRAKKIKNNIKDTISLIFTVLAMGGWFILLLILYAIEYVYEFLSHATNRKTSGSDTKQS